MKTGILISIGIALNLVGILIIAQIIENGDINAISMYFLVYGFFAIGIGILNGFYLNLVERKTLNLNYLIGLGILPIGTLIGFSISGIFRLTFIGEFGLVGIGITNLIWIIEQILNEKPELTGLEKFKLKNADDRMGDIMILGDTGNQ